MDKATDSGSVNAGSIPVRGAKIYGGTMEKAILVGVKLIEDENFEYSMEELKNLAEACNNTFLYLTCKGTKIF